jgi:glycosyltransferase involved in cell wall biosynthesis
MVARDDPLKDHENLIAAAERLASRFPMIRIVLAGRGIDQPDGRVKAAIQRSSAAGRFIALGERHDVPAILNALDVFCLSSASEGFPNVLAEAMSCGLPSVSTDAGDARVILGEAGFCVPVRQPIALAAAIGSVLELSASARQELGMRARRRIESTFAIDAAWQRYQALYAEVLASRRLSGE